MWQYHKVHIDDIVLDASYRIKQLYGRQFDRFDRESSEAR